MDNIIANTLYGELPEYKTYLNCDRVYGEECGCVVCKYSEYTTSITTGEGMFLCVRR